MMRLVAMTVLVAGLVSTGASAYPNNSDALRQQCQTQECRECVDQCDRDLDHRMNDCNAQYPRPSENQQMCFYWAAADHNMCLNYECGL